MLILRWYIARVHQEEEPSGAERIVKMNSSEGTRVDVQIDFSTDELIRTIEGELHSLQQLHDHLDFWKVDFQLEGWTYAQAIFEAIVERNAITEIEELPRRTIAEDMVIVQCFAESRGLLGDVLGQYHYQIEQNRDPELTWLITDFFDAKWLDFTIPARRMAKQVYRNLLAAQDNDEQEQADEMGAS